MKLRFAVVTALVACGGMVDPQAVDDQPSAAQAGNADNAAGAKVPLPAGIPRGPARAAGAAGTTPYAPLESPSTIVPATLARKAVISGMSANWTLYVIDDDPERPGQYRAFVGHKSVLERHAVSTDSSMPGTFLIDRGMPNQIAITSTSVRGGGQDGPLGPIPDDVRALYGAVANDSPESLVYGPSVLWQGSLLFVVGPAAGGALGVPRVFYGPSDGPFVERTFLGFGPSDSFDSATPATTVTFDLDGAPTTLPAAVTHETAGLINGFGSSALKFLCF